ncbi:MAG: hypothetical protein QOK35_3010 [Pseudonocardiales bacterium]|nr:hypothetical protein [Pseudonocardiales bacterium]
MPLTAPSPTTSPAVPRPRIGRAVPVLLVVVALFLALELPAYVGFDPAASRVPARPDLPLHYPLLVAHILFGSVALITACLQVWPWLRRAHPVVHRWSGRVYLFGGVFPGGLAVLAVAPVSSTGPVSAVGNTALAVLWLATAVAGFRAARARRYGDHRRWMLRSVALTFSIVANRLWLVAYFLLFTPFLGEDPTALGLAAAGASVWTSWVVNLLVVEWWVLRPARRRRHRSV